MLYKGDSIYLYIVDFDPEFNGFGFFASDKWGEGNAGRYSQYGPRTVRMTEKRLW